MGYTSSQAKEFIKYIAPLIVSEATARGYKIRSTVIAQAIVEGACGTSRLAKEFHNHFGMKCGSKWRGAYANLKTKEEYVVGQVTEIRDNFRAYKDDIEGIKGYYDFINTKNYANLRNAKNYRQYAEYLKADKWATSSTYVNTLCNTVKKYGLWAYDENVNVEYFPKYEGDTDSIIDALNAVGVSNTPSYRQEIYNANFTDSYTRSAKQNTAMLILLKQGILVKP